MNSLPEPEVTRKARRRQFSVEYKLRILAEAEASRERGQIGVLLRREGLYASTLDKWRAAAIIGRVVPLLRRHHQRRRPQQRWRERMNY